MDIYYGITEICSNEDIDISIELYRMMFGLSVNALNFNEGSISINPRGTYSYQLTPSNPQIDLVVEMGSMPFYQFFPNRAPTTEEMLNWQPNRDAFLSIVYTDPSGLEFHLDQRLR